MKISRLRSLFIAYQTRFSAIFTCADKSYLTHPYLTHGTDKQVAERAMIAHLNPMCQSQISFQKTYEWAMEITGLKERQVKQHDSFMATPTIKSNTGDRKVCIQGSHSQSATKFPDFSVTFPDQILFFPDQNNEFLRHFSLFAADK